MDGTALTKRHQLARFHQYPIVPFRRRRHAGGNRPAITRPFIPASSLVTTSASIPHLTSGNTSPPSQMGERPLPLELAGPIHLSAHNPDILYMGANNCSAPSTRARTLKKFPEDLTRGGLKGRRAIRHPQPSTSRPCSSVSLYTGSDDGLLHLSHDGGFSWTNISASMPENLCEPRRYQPRERASTPPSTAIAGMTSRPTFTFRKTTGRTGPPSAQTCPGAINVIKEDPENPDLLYVRYRPRPLCFPRPGRLMQLNNHLPATPVRSTVVHPQEKDLVVEHMGGPLYRQR